MPLEALTTRVKTLEDTQAKEHMESVLRDQHIEDLLKEVLRNQADHKENMVHRHEFTPIQKLVYGGAGVILATVLASGLALVIIGVK